ncbi:MAG: biotin/lipoate A/B protein ligase family protein [Gammaproteobacteria bacterium]
MRVIDTGLLPGRRNVALDQALIESHRAGNSADTLRFLAFSPSALVGRHQDLSREVDLAFCAAHGIDVGRRVTGGGAIYLDEGQLGWELICARETLGGGALEDLAARICTAAAAGLATLGIDARFRPRNDIEVDGRKIGGTGGFFDGGTLFYQGTVIGELDPATMFGALQVPGDKRARRDHAPPAARVTSLAALLGRAPPWPAVKQALAAAFAAAFGLDCATGELDAREASAAAACYADEIGTAAFVHEIDGLGADGAARHAHRVTAGGTIAVHARLAATGTPRLEQVVFSGDFFVTPPRVLFDLEGALRQVEVARAAEVAADYLAAAPIELISVAPGAIVETLRAALHDGPG